MNLELKRAREIKRYRNLTPEQRAVRSAKQRRNKLKRVYGIEPHDYDALMSAQKGTCAICYENLDALHRPHIDHDHETGKVRGILCGSCNRGIGYLRDNSEIARRASLYLKGVRDYN